MNVRALIAVIAVTAAIEAHAQCAVEGDCKAGRVCVQGVCRYEADAQRVAGDADGLRTTNPDPPAPAKASRPRTVKRPTAAALAAYRHFSQVPEAWRDAWWEANPRRRGLGFHPLATIIGAALGELTGLSMVVLQFEFFSPVTRWFSVYVQVAPMFLLGDGGGGIAVTAGGGVRIHAQGNAPDGLFLSAGAKATTAPQAGALGATVSAGYQFMFEGFFVIPSVGVALSTAAAPTIHLELPIGFTF